MLRPSRPLTTVLLWLAIALLPLRAWAAASMPATIDVETPVAVHASVEMPCHGADTDPADNDSAAGHGCSLCSVCHSAAATLPSSPAPMPAVAHGHPRIEPGPGIERPVHSGPERPPRHLRA